MIARWRFFILQAVWKVRYLYGYPPPPSNDKSYCESTDLAATVPFNVFYHPPILSFCKCVDVWYISLNNRFGGDTIKKKNVFTAATNAGTPHNFPPKLYRLLHSYSPVVYVIFHITQTGPVIIPRSSFSHFFLLDSKTPFQQHLPAGIPPQFRWCF